MSSLNRKSSKGAGLLTKHRHYAFYASTKRKREEPPPRPEARQWFPGNRSEFETKRRRGNEYLDDMTRLQRGQYDSAEDDAPRNPRPVPKQRTQYQFHLLEQKIQEQLLRVHTTRYLQPDSNIQAELLYPPQENPQYVPRFRTRRKKDLDVFPKEPWNHWFSRLAHQKWVQWFHRPEPAPTEQSIQHQLLYGPHELSEEDEDDTPLHLPQPFKKRKLNSGLTSNVPNSFLGNPTARLGILPAVTIHGFRVFCRVSKKLIPAAARCGVEVVRSTASATSRLVEDVKNNAAGKVGKDHVQGDDEQNDKEGLPGNEIEKEDSESESDESDDSDDDDTPKPYGTGPRLPAPRPKSDILPDYLIPARMPKDLTTRGKKNRGENGSTKKQGAEGQNAAQTVKSTDTVPVETTATVNGNSKRPAQPDSGAAVERPLKKRNTTAQPAQPYSSAAVECPLKKRDIRRETQESTQSSSRPAQPNSSAIVERPFEGKTALQTQKSTQPPKRPAQPNSDAVVERPFERKTALQTQKSTQSSKIPAQPDSGATVERLLKKRTTTPEAQESTQTQESTQPPKRPVQPVSSAAVERPLERKTTSQTQKSTQSTQTHITCPNCTTNHSTETAFCENCGTPWPSKPAPTSQAQYTIRKSHKPDVIHFPAIGNQKAIDITLVTYRGDRRSVRKPRQESDEEDYTMTGGAGPVDTLDVDGTPFDIPEKERARLLKEARVRNEKSEKREVNERRRREMAMLNGLNYPYSQPYFEEISHLHTKEVTKTPNVDKGTKEPKKPKTDAEKMEKTKTKNTIERIWEEQCIADIAQHYLDGVAEMQREARAQGRVFPEGITGWNEMSEAEQQRVRWATRAIEKNGRRSSSAADQATKQRAGVEKTQEQQVFEIDEALVARFENGPNASLVRDLAEERTHMMFAGNQWPEDLTGWADEYTDEERNLVLEATRYLELQEAIENSTQQHRAEFSDESSLEDDD